MEHTIRTLITVARFIEGLAHSIKERAIQSLSQKQIKAARELDAKLKQRGQEWDSERRRHADSMKRISKAALEDGANCDTCVSELEAKIKRIELS